MADLLDAFSRAAHLVLGFDAGPLLVVALSLGGSAAATLAASLLGLPLFVVGLAIYLLLLRAGPLGNFGLLFTSAAMALAHLLLARPIVAALAHRAADGVWRTYGDDLRINGAGLWPSVRTVLAIGRAEMLTAMLAGFGRTISEVGAILVVGGNIAGYTCTLTTSIVLEF